MRKKMTLENSIYKGKSYDRNKYEIGREIKIRYDGKLRDRLFLFVLFWT